jgi:hypothetical protein
MNDKTIKSWLDEAITYRQFLAEQVMLREEVSWIQAYEATSTILLSHPEINGDALKPRREWIV